ncbi:MAG: AraC family transcriptional regulator [Bacteroidota bacterium]
MSYLDSDKYYDHFSKKAFKSIPAFKREQNYMMSFVAPLESYSFDDNSLTITYIKKGGGELHWINGNGKKVDIKQNRFVVVDPNFGWHYINENSSDLDVLSLVISDELRKQLNYYRTSSEDKMLALPFEQVEGGLFYIENILNADHYLTGQSLKSIHSYAATNGLKHYSPEEITIELLHQLYREKSNINALAHRIKAKKSSTQVETLKRLMIVQEYIHDNLTREISLLELADVSCLSKHHLFESFKRIYGKTPYQYIINEKINKSRDYLKSGEFAVNQVSAMLGFSDYSVFSKLFKKIHGISPSHYVSNHSK